MYFSDLKYEYEQWINDSSYKIENKQRLNLSNHAYRVLQNDAILFRIKEVNNVLESGMINHVFRNYRLKAKASISYNAYKKEKLAKL